MVYERRERHRRTVDHRKRARKQSASGSVNVSWESARVSAATRERKPKDNRLVFIGLDLVLLTCNVQAWCNFGAKGE